MSTLLQSAVSFLSTKLNNEVKRNLIIEDSMKTENSVCRKSKSLMLNTAYLSAYPVQLISCLIVILTKQNQSVLYV